MSVVNQSSRNVCGCGAKFRCGEMLRLESGKCKGSNRRGASVL